MFNDGGYSNASADANEAAFYAQGMADLAKQIAAVRGVFTTESLEANAKHLNDKEDWSSMTFYADGSCVTNYDSGASYEGDGDGSDKKESGKKSSSLSKALKAGGIVIAAGGGPEDIPADVVAVVVIAGVYIYITEVKDFSADRDQWTETVPDPATDFNRINSRFNNDMNKFNREQFPDSKGWAKWLFIETTIYEIYHNETDFYENLPVAPPPINPGYNHIHPEK